VSPQSPLYFVDKEKENTKREDKNFTNGKFLDAMRTALDPGASRVCDLFGRERKGYT